MNRDSGKLNNGDIWLDRRELIRVASGSGGYDGDRWYSGGGLLEVGGYLGTMGVPVSHWLAQGGQVRFESAEVVTQKGSSINLSGGTLDVRAGTLQQTWLRGADGRLYVADKAPGDVLYTGVYQGYEQRSARWGERPRAASTTRCWRRAPATRTATRSAATPARCSSRPAAPCWKAIWSATPTRARARTARRSPGWTATASRSAPPRAAPAWWSATMCATTTRPRARSIPSWAPPAARWPKWCWARGARPGPGRRLAAGKQGQAVPGREPAQRLLAGPAARRGRTFHHRRCGLARRRWRRNHAVCAGCGHQGQSDQPWRPDPGRQRAVSTVVPGRAARGLGAGPGRQPAGAAARRGRRDAERARRLGQSAAGRRRPGRPAGARRRPHRAARHR